MPAPVSPWCERYDDGRHRLLAGATSASTLASLMRGELADVLYSDPPWGEGNAKYWRTHARVPCPSAPWLEVKSGLREALALVRPGAPVWIEMGERWVDEIVTLLHVAGFDVSRHWTTRYRSGGELLPCALLYSGPELPASFDPSDLRGAALPRRCLAASVLPRGSRVLDPFCGKGYTARAAQVNGLRFRGLELNPHRLGYTEQWLRRMSRS